MPQVVLVNPQIPPNTGNIARTCAATCTQLHLVAPLGFEISDRYLKRAGLDYWPYVNLHYHDSIDAFQLYQHLLPLLASGRLQYGEEVSLVQRRLYHSNRETTENYLKLFRLHSDKLAAQELYEDEIFGFGDYSDLRLESANE